MDNYSIYATGTLIASHRLSTHSKRSTLISAMRIEILLEPYIERSHLGILLVCALQVRKAVKWALEMGYR